MQQVLKIAWYVVLNTHHHELGQRSNQNYYPTCHKNGKPLEECNHFSLLTWLGIIFVLVVVKHFNCAENYTRLIPLPNHLQPCYIATTILNMLSNDAANHSQLQGAPNFTAGSKLDWLSH
eukprot:2605927-Amphidinium_carterae.1